jgi:hypothetical protein
MQRRQAGTHLRYSACVSQQAFSCASRLASPPGSPHPPTHPPGWPGSWASWRASAPGHEQRLPAPTAGGGGKAGLMLHTLMLHTVCVLLCADLFALRPQAALPPAVTCHPPTHLVQGWVSHPPHCPGPGDVLHLLRGHAPHVPQQLMGGGSPHVLVVILSGRKRLGCCDYLRAHTRMHQAELCSPSRRGDGCG